MFDKQKINFRKISSSDLKILFKWLNSKHVHEFYDADKENTFEDIKKRYLPKIRGEKSTDCYLVEYDGNSVGYIQKYFVNDWPEFGNYLDYDDRVVSVDLFIGEQNFMGIGFGSFMLFEFINQIVFKISGVSLCIIGPEPNNKRAIRAYQKVGFKHVKTLRIGDEKEDTYIMELSK